MIDERIDSGMETAMMMVLRQLPRNSRIIRPVSTAAITASRTTPVMDARTKMDWSPIGLICSSGGTVDAIRGSSARTPLTTRQRRGVAGLQNGEQNAAVAVLPHDVGLRDAAVAHRGDVVHIDRRAVYLAQRQIADSRERNRR